MNQGFSNKINATRGLMTRLDFVINLTRHGLWTLHGSIRVHVHACYHNIYFLMFNCAPGWCLYCNILCRGGSTLWKGGAVQGSSEKGCVCVCVCVRGHYLPFLSILHIKMTYLSNKKGVPIPPFPLDLPLLRMN